MFPELTETPSLLIFLGATCSQGPRIFAMATWKRLLLIGVGAGAGFAAFLTLVAGGWLWYRSRPKLPKPWNTTAIKATFDRVRVVGQNNDIAFFYVLENMTNSDYRVENASDTYLIARLKQQKSLSEFEGNFQKLHFPIFIPARQRVWVPIELSYPYQEKLASDASGKERHKWRQKLREFVKSQMGNLNGFVLFDNKNRYQINFPRPW